jgi:hypothetical protein
MRHLNCEFVAASENLHRQECPCYCNNKKLLAPRGSQESSVHRIFRWTVMANSIAFQFHDEV